MELALNVFCFFCGAVILYRCGEHLDLMRSTSNHAMRVAYWSLAVGGLALVFSAFDREEWLRPLGWICIVIGVTLRCLFDKRSALDRHSARRGDRVAG